MTHNQSVGIAQRASRMRMGVRVQGGGDTHNDIFRLDGHRPRSGPAHLRVRHVAGEPFAHDAFQDLIDELELVPRHLERGLLELVRLQARIIVQVVHCTITLGLHAGSLSQQKTGRAGRPLPHMRFPTVRPHI